MAFAKDSVIVTRRSVDFMSIGIESVRAIDCCLNEEEQLKLMFLLYDDDEEVALALQKMTVYCESLKNGCNRGPGPFLEWAEAQNCRNAQNWTNKLLESLCLIQHMQLMKRYEPSIEKVKAVANIDPKSYTFNQGNINKQRKMLFYLCDNLTQEEFKKLKASMNHIETFAPYDLMEMHILSWISQKLISTANDSYDLSKLVSALDGVNIPRQVLEKFKELKRCSCSEEPEESKLTKSVPAGTSNSFPSLSRPHSEANSLTSCSSLLSNVSSNPEDSSRYYKMEYNHSGLCIIFSQRNFEPDEDPDVQSEVADHLLEDRIGTDVDRDSLEETFRMFGYEVLVYNNYSDNSIRRNLTSLAQTGRYTSLIVCILSHGYQDHVYGSNCIAVNIQELMQLFSGTACRSLINKPKVFFVQACQGSESQEAVGVPYEEDNHHLPVIRTSPNISDFLLGMATVPGYTSFRSKETGTIYIRTLCEVLQKTGHTDDILSNLTEVNRKVSEVRANIEGKAKKMMPQPMFTLRRKLSFLRHQEHFVESIGKMIERYLTYSLFEEFLQSDRVRRIIASINI